MAPRPWKGTSLVLKFPLEVDLHIQAREHAPHLREKADRFCASLSDPQAMETTRARILGRLRDDFSKHVKAYEGLGGIGSFEQVPLLAKGALRPRLQDFVDPRFSFAQMRRKYSSGTTGRPMPLLYAPSFVAETLFLGLHNMLRRAGVPTPQDRPVFCASLAPANQYNEEFVTIDPLQGDGLSLKIGFDEQSPESMARLFSLLEALDPAVVTSRPNLFEVLVKNAPADWPSRRGSPVAVFSSGAPLDEDLRQDVERLFGARCFNAYGMSEVGMVASECAHRQGLHVDESGYVVEVCDGQGRPLPPGEEGELVLSTDANPAMPLLRYRSGDLGALDASPCPCGAKGVRIAKLSGRHIPSFPLASGVLLDSYLFQPLFFRFPVKEFQITQTSHEDYEVLVEPLEDVPDVPLLLREVREWVLAVFPSPVDVRIEPTRFNKRSSFQRYRTLLQPSRPS